LADHEDTCNRARGVLVPYGDSLSAMQVSALPWPLGHTIDCDPIRGHCSCYIRQQGGSFCWKP